MIDLITFWFFRLWPRKSKRRTPPIPPTIVAPFVERIPMFRGRIDPTGSSATSYTWLVWIKGINPRPVVWIPPCRKALERAGDYDPLVEGRVA